MKLLPILSILALVLLLGCVQTPGGNNGNPNPGNGNETPLPASISGWWEYSPIQAETNPWQTIDIAFIHEATEEEQVQAWLSTLNVSFDHVTFVPSDDIVCQALNCPRGDHLLVHALSTESERKLVENGFTPSHRAFIFYTHTANDYTVTLVNLLDKPIFFGGCNDIVPEKEENGVFIPRPEKVCIWEGIPTQLAAHAQTTFSWHAMQNGTFRISLGYGVGCAADQPLSQASCTSMEILSTNPFSISGNASSAYIVMDYSPKQCRSNPWQQPPYFTGVVDENHIPTQTQESTAFSAWMNDNALHPLDVTFTRNTGTIARVCAACSCPDGSTYSVVLSADERVTAESNGFVYSHTYVAPLSPPDYSSVAWYVYTPYQCYANLWNSTNDPIHSVEKDIRKLTEWLGEKGVKVTHTAFIRGVSLSQQCTKKSTDFYGVGVEQSDDASRQILASLAFVPAGKTQTALFTETTDETPVKLLYRTKFCSTFPWGTPDLAVGNEAAVSERVVEWLAEQGMTSYDVPTIHNIPPSATGTCDTDSGLGVLVTVPQWSATHLGAVGFLKPNTLFDAEKTQRYPVIAEEMEATAEVSS